MFDLKVQAANKPGNDFIVCSKIGSRLNLMNCPFIFKFSRFYVCDWERCMFNGVRQLKYQTKYKTRNTGKDRKADQPVSKPHHIDRQTNKQKSMKQFKSPKNSVV